jgi:hypothetical protein
MTQGSYYDCCCPCFYRYQEGDHRCHLRWNQGIVSPPTLYYFLPFLTLPSTCLGSSFGNCCSSSGWCGTTADYCGTGCQTGFGNCGSNNPVSTPKAASSTKVVPASTPTPSKAAGKVSTDGTCSGASGFTCSGSSFGNCCSQYGWCGSTTDHCGASCNAAFGTCSGSQAVKPADAVAAPAPAPTPAKKAETSGNCNSWFHFFGLC